MPPNTRSRWIFSLGLPDRAAGRNRTRLSPRPRFVFEDRPDNRSHQVIPGENLHQIAATEFRNVTAFDRPELLWWVVADYNNIRDPTRKLGTGTLLLIPSDSKISAWFAGDDNTVQFKV
jgi:hypothetical protein